MAKTIHPGPRPPNVQRNAPAERGRGRAQAGKAQGVKRPEEVREEEGIDEESMSSTQDDDALREVEREEQRRYGAFRRDNQDFNKQAEAEAKAPKPSTESVIPGPNSPLSASAPGKAPAAPPSPVEAKAPPPGAPAPAAASTPRAAAAASIESLLTAELMKKSSRGIYNAPSAPPKTSAPAAPAAPARPKVTMTTRPAAPAASSAVSLPPTRVDARALLTTAQPAGSLLSQASRMATPPALPPQLADAAAEARRMLTGVRGVEHVAAGVFKGEPVVVIGVEFGLTREALRALPEKVQDFKTVISLPFEALPLRRAPQGK